MRKRTAKRALLGTLCAAALALVAAAPAAQGAAGDPLFLFTPKPSPPQFPGDQPDLVPPPIGYLNGPCGLGVDSGGRFYISDYYHGVVDVYGGNANYASTNPPPTGSTGYVTQMLSPNLIDGPCGTALDASNKLYVNNYHRNVIRYEPAPSFGPGTVITGAPLDSVRPTGVSVDPVTGYAYVNARTYIAVYDSSGAPVLDGGEPLKIGTGTLIEGYGVAVSTYAGTLGRIYVPDAATDTVRIYDPLVSKTNPIGELKRPVNQPFISLHDSVVAIDRVTGDVYVADNTQPVDSEHPQATIYIYSSTGTYKGHLKYNVYDSLPPGLAVDNSAGANQGRVYVTTGNSEKAGVYAYPPGSGVFGSPLPPGQTLTLSASGSGGGSISSLSDIYCSSVCTEQMLAAERVSLTATPDPGSEFTGWSGDACSGAGPTCTLTMDEATTVSANFLGESFSNQAPQATPSPLISPSGQEAQKPRAQGKKRCRKAKKRCARAKRHHHRIAKRR
jgi:hypothetical protein